MLDGDRGKTKNHFAAKTFLFGSFSAFMACLLNLNNYSRRNADDKQAHIFNEIKVLREKNCSLPSGNRSFVSMLHSAKTYGRGNKKKIVFLFHHLIE